MAFLEVRNCCGTKELGVSSWFESEKQLITSAKQRSIIIFKLGFLQA